MYEGRRHHLLIRGLALVVIALAMWMGPRELTATMTCSPTCGWEECVAPSFCEEQTGCTNLSSNCRSCAFVVSCGEECGAGAVMLQCWVVPPH